MKARVALSARRPCDTIGRLMSKRASRRQFLKSAGYTGGAALIGVGGLNWISPSIWRNPLALEPNRSYWARAQQPRNPMLSQDITVDVAIVGGGLTGLSSAYFIRKVSPQKSVVVLEAQGCGNGASGRNGAMVSLNTSRPNFLRLPRFGGHGWERKSLVSCF